MSAEDVKEINRSANIGIFSFPHDTVDLTLERVQEVVQREARLSILTLYAGNEYP